MEVKESEKIVASLPPFVWVINVCGTKSTSDKKTKFVSLKVPPVLITFYIHMPWMDDTTQHKIDDLLKLTY